MPAARGGIAARLRPRAIVVRAISPRWRPRRRCTLIAASVGEARVEGGSRGPSRCERLGEVETRTCMKGLGAVIVADTPAECAAFPKKAHEGWDHVIEASGVKAA